MSASDLLKTYAFISDTTNELCYIEAKAKEGDLPADFHKVALQAIEDAKVTLSEGKKALATYRSRYRSQIVSKAMGMDLGQMADLPAELEGELEEAVEKTHKGPEGEKLHESLHDALHGGDDLEEELELPGEEAMDMDYAMDYAMDYPTTAEARKSWRDQIVAEAKGKGGKWDDIYTEQRSGGGHTLEGLGISVADNGDKVETEDEIHAVMEDIATKPLGKIKEAAEKLDKWIKSGGININKLDMLIAEGAVDSEVVKYWKQYYGEVDGGREWAAQLVSDFDKGSKKTASLEDIEAHEVRIRRSYSVAQEAQKKGIIGSTPADLERYVDSMKNLPDPVFNHFKNHVASYRAPQQLVSAPLVGINERESGISVGNMDKTASTANTVAPTFENLQRMFG
jgi:hypothetical protein